MKLIRQSSDFHHLHMFIPKIYHFANRQQSIVIFQQTIKEQIFTFV